MITPEPDVAGIVMRMERAALERWGQGDPDGFLEISAADVSYFDPFTTPRLDGLSALRSWYDQVRGKIHIERFEIIEPRVQIAGGVAVLTYRFDSHGSEGSMRWNTTEVYQKSPDGWKIFHTHWAFHQPKIAA
jgi:ketosteroid isomerase-like protein